MATGTLRRGIGGWYISIVPRHRRRRGPKRVFLRAALGAAVLSMIAPVLVGAILPTMSTGAVQGIQSEASQSVDRVRLTTSQVAARTTTQAFSGFGGTSIESRDYLAAYPEPAAPSTLTGYRWPLLHGRVTLPFGPSQWGSRVVNGGAFHDGLDLATFCGDRIVAAHDGTVLAAGRRYDTKMGWVGDLQAYLARLDEKSLWTTLPIVVVVDDGNGYRSIYAHLSETAIERGESVKAGQLLGYEGMTGRASGCHLHYGLFSPLETDRFGIDPGVVERMLLPAYQIARIDPMLVLPARSGAPESEPKEAKPPLE